MAVAGVGIKWLIQKLGIVEDEVALNKLALSLDSNDGVYLVPAFSGLLAPCTLRWWRGDAKQGHIPPHIACWAHFGRVAP